MSKQVYAIATMDTKGEEIAFVADCLRHAGVAVRTIDVGTKEVPAVHPNISRDDVLAGSAIPASGDRGQAITAMGDALRTYLKNESDSGRLAGVIGIGGSGGTALITAAMRALPVGMPKLMVSTMASGNTAPYVDCSDITMMYSVVDVAGLNVVSKTVLRNAANAMAGMVRYFEEEPQSCSTLAMTMFGVTTPCVTLVRQQLEQEGHDCLVFHATGSGGRAMEQLVASGMIDGVLDITTTEVADEVVGGVMPAGKQRFDALIESNIPLVLSLGAVDMVNFGGRETVPEKFEGRQFHVHNAQVTLMRTTPEENRQIARWITTKLNRATTPVTVVVPEGGVSALDAPGEAFHNPEASEALFSELRATLQQDSVRKLVFAPHHINDPEFAQLLLDEFHVLLSGRATS
ncbi:MAG: Tm-1-like ATP-binding domain-containing protein [Planctomycetaceae bacterium]|nr:Tm-1-like ATP-binding domain-containing protein [Planctomycetaceae bacterium]